MSGLHRYFGVVDVRWELPFLLRLRPNAFLCWEPQEGVATIGTTASVGAVQWRRRTPLLSSEQAFGESFGAQSEPPNALLTHDYRMETVIGGKHYLATEITGGKDGGFEEVHAYSVANVFLCLRRREEFGIASMMPRAVAALNNVITVHSFLMADGLTRPLRMELDSYYTTFSLAQVPRDWPQMTVEHLLLRLGELKFGSDMGITRVNQVGVGSGDDLTIRPFSNDVLRSLASLVRGEVQLDVHQRLLLSALRRLRRREFFLAVIDAEAAVEVCIAELIRRVMQRQGRTDTEIDEFFEHNIPRPQHQIAYLDKLIQAVQQGRSRFEGSDVHRRWKQELADLRHEIVHRGLRQVESDAAVAAVASGVETTIHLERLLPEFVEGLRWDPNFARLDNVRPAVGKLFRLFDA